MYNVIVMLLSSYVFENFRKKITKNNLDSVFFFFVIFPSLSWMYTLTEPETELQLLTDIDLLHIRGNGIRRGITRAIKQC